jgi:hypothetical protein
MDSYESREFRDPKLGIDATDTKGVIKSCEWKKDGQYNGQMQKDKETTNDLPNTTLKTKDKTTRTPLITGAEILCSRRVRSSCSTSGTHDSHCRHSGAMT